MQVKGCFQGLTWLLLLVCTTAQADRLDPTKASPRDKDYSWMSIAQWYQQHQDDVAVATIGDADVLFIGDSITAGWTPALWQKHFAPLKAANFGIGGDKTQNLLWRLDNGAVGNLKPKVINLLIGVNNIGHDSATPRQVYRGVEAVVDKLQQAFPTTPILLNGILPTGETNMHPNRVKAKQSNALLSKLATRPGVIYVEIWQPFLEKDGRIAKAVMADFLHPTELGYQIYAKHLLPKIQEYLTTPVE